MTGRIIILSLGFLILPGWLNAQEGMKLQDSKQELDRIKSQLKETRGKVDSLKSVEAGLQKEIAGYDERVDRNRKVVSKLEGDLRKVRGQIDNESGHLEQTTQRLNDKKQRYINFLKDYYRQRNRFAGLAELSFETYLKRERRNQYLAAVTKRSTHEIRQAADTMSSLTQSIENLKSKGSDLDKLKKEKKSRINLDLALKDKEESNLGTVRRQTTLLQDRLVSLSEVARQMEEIVARLEQEQQERQQKFGEMARMVPGNFSGLKGHMQIPIRGKIVDSFGWKTNPVTKLKSFSPGIDIQPTAGNKQVVSAAPGRVVYVGSLRGYDNFVILEHDDGYYTTYAGLDKVTVENNELVDTGHSLGTVGTGPVHFELRQGREHLDPVIWLNIDGF